MLQSDSSITALIQPGATMFKPIALAALLAAPLCTSAADSAKATSAGADDKAKTSQQEKMDSCNREAGDKALKGDERQTFISQCLSAGKSHASSAHQAKMKACNKEAGDKALKGDDRKKFMSGCLKGSTKS
jgi:hypothetical protein